MDRLKPYREIISKPAGLMLVVLIIAGLATKLLLSLNLTLRSSRTIPGLEAMEIFRHGNLLLDGFYLQANNPYIFTDILPFHLLLQAISGYNPSVLRLTGFLIFFLIIVVYALLVYRLTEDKTSALIMAGLLSCMTPLAAYYYMGIVAHGATILAIGVLLLVFRPDENMGTYKQIAMAVLIFLFTFSDNLFLIVYVAPLAFTLILLDYIRKRLSLSSMKLPLFAVLVPAFLAYFCKSLVPYFLKPDNSIHVKDILPKLSLYADGVGQVVYDGFADMLSLHIGLSWIGGIAAVIAIAVAALNLRGKSDRRMLPFVLFLSISAALMFFAFMLTDYAFTEGSSRYLMFTGISLFAIVAMGNNGKKIYLALMVLIMAIGLLSSAVYLSEIKSGPNQDQVDLIELLVENNLTYGYSGYQDSNTLTYLSNEEVTVRPVMSDGKRLYDIPWLSCARWFDEVPPDTFFIVCNTTSTYQEFGEDPDTTLTKIQAPVKKLTYKYFLVYVYNNSSMVMP